MQQQGAQAQSRYLETWPEGVVQRLTDRRSAKEPQSTGIGSATVYHFRGGDGQTQSQEHRVVSQTNIFVADGLPPVLLDRLPHPEGSAQ